MAVERVLYRCSLF